MVATWLAVVALLVASLAFALARPSFQWFPFLDGAEGLLTALVLAAGAWLVAERRPGLAAVMLVMAALAAGTGFTSGLALAGAFDRWAIGAGAAIAVGALTLTDYASARERRLGWWVMPIGLSFVALAVSATVASALYRAAAPPDDDGLPTLVYYASLWVELGLPILVPGVLGLLGGLRLAGRRYEAVATRRGEHREPAWLFPSFAAFTAAAIALTAVAPEVPEVSSGQEVFVPILWLVVALGVDRWSRFAAWSAMAVALLIGGARPFVEAIRRADVDLVPGKVWGDPATADATRPMVLLVAVTLAVAVLVGWEALRTVEGGRWPRAAGAVVATGVLGACLWIAASGQALMLYLVAAPVGMPGLMTPIIVLGPILAGGGLLAWRRLVPALAVAESASPGRGLTAYVGTVLTEFVTASSAVRRAAVETERSRLASDLHAEVLPSLAQVAAAAEAGAPPDVIAARLRDVEADVRDLVAERRLVVLEEFGLVEALEWLADRAEERTTFPIGLAVDGASTDDRPPREVERAAFRIAQLAVENAIQHAKATRLELEVLVRRDRVRVVVADDGSGTEPDAAASAARTNRQGLVDMRRQAGQVRGQLDIQASQGGGTTVTFAWGGA